MAFTRASSAPAKRPPRDRRRYTVCLMAVGGAALILAIGSPHGLWTPWRIFYQYVPGFAGIRVTARLAGVTLLAGAVLAGVGLDALLKLLPHAWLRTAVSVVACIVVLVELAGPLSWVTLPSDRATLAVYHALSHRPPGAVMEVPLTNPEYDSVRWSYTEPVRMVWSTIDWHPRINGYSGYEPATYADNATVLATLPTAPALARLRTLHVRYLILHVGFQAGYLMLTQTQATFLINRLPPGAVTTRYGPNYLVDLGPQ